MRANRWLTACTVCQAHWWLGWALCQLSKVDLFSFIPGAFIGAASFFGAGAPLDAKLGWVLASIVCGAAMGLFSERLGKLLTAKA